MLTRSYEHDNIYKLSQTRNTKKGRKQKRKGSQETDTRLTSETVCDKVLKVASERGGTK